MHGMHNSKLFSIRLFSIDNEWATNDNQFTDI